MCERIVHSQIFPEHLLQAEHCADVEDAAMSSDAVPALRGLID